MPYKLAVFDWNGTLMDDVEANLKGCNATLELAGCPPITTERYRDTMDFPVIHLYSRNGIPVDEYLANFQEYGLTFLTTYKEAAKSASLRRGAHELLAWLLEEGMDLMVLSNYVQHELEAQMAEHHATKYFKHINGNLAFNEEEHTRTTKAGRLLSVMDEHGYAPDEIFIIGDSLEEPDIAKQLGLTCFSVTWGCLSEERLRQSPTHHIVHELQDVRQILQTA